MRGRYLRRIGGLILALLVLPGVAALSSTTAQAQRRIVVVRPYRPIYRPFYNPGGNTGRGVTPILRLLQPLWALCL